MIQVDLQLSHKIDPWNRKPVRESAWASDSQSASNAIAIRPWVYCTTDCLLASLMIGQSPTIGYFTAELGLRSSVEHVLRRFESACVGFDPVFALAESEELAGRGARQSTS